MQEAEWLASADPAAMIAWLTAQRRGEVPRGDPANKAVSDRKLRLWLAACCRAAWGSLTDERSRRAVEVAEYYADGQAADPERAEALQAALRAARPMPAGPAQVAAATAAHCCQRPIGPMSTLRDQERDLPGLTRADQAALLRDLVGNPWRPLSCKHCYRGAVPTDRGDDTCEVCGGSGRLPLRQLTPTVLSLARAAYEERRGWPCGHCNGRGGGIYGLEETEWECERCEGTGRTGEGFLDPARLSVLSDALEEAGCEEMALLHHLRSPGQHARGCWVLDLLLGRE